METSGVYISNLPFNITKEELISDLIEHFPADFRQPLTDGTSEVVVYEPGRRENGHYAQVAVVQNITVNLDRLTKAALKYWIKGRKYCFRKDYGEDRDKFGLRVTKLTPDEVRAYKQFQGEQTEKPLQIFNKSFISQVGPKVFNGTKTLFVKDSASEGPINPQLFTDIGLKVTNVIHVQSTHVYKLEFETALDAVQAIASHNGDQMVFSNQLGITASQLNMIKGLGPKGEAINILNEVKKHGYVGFEAINPNILDVQRMHSYGSICWKCKTRYSLNGIEPNLNFVAGICSCNYDESLDVFHAKRAFFCENEKFTRLILERSAIESEPYDHWIIKHSPIKQTFASNQEYMNWSAPLLQEDWFVYARNYKKDYTCRGEILNFLKIEEQKASNDETAKSYYCAELLIVKTDFWNPDSAQRIGGLTLNIQTKHVNFEGTKIEERRGKLCRITSSNVPNKVKLVTKFFLSCNRFPVKGSDAKIIPKPIKKPYEAAKKILNSWKLEPARFPFLNSIMIKQTSLEMPGELAATQMDPSFFRRGIVLLRKKMNLKQKDAVDMAKTSVVSVIQGPPGTGKTYTAACLVYELAKTERNHILCTAPSNYAANGLTEKIGSISEHKLLPMKVLRMFSKRRETQFLKSGKTLDFGPNVTVLHEAVRRSSKWLQSDADDKLLPKIMQKLTHNREDYLTKEEEERLDEHIYEIECDIFKSHKAIVATCSTATDGRLHSYNGKICSVLVDEAGQLQQAYSLTLFGFGQFRTVFLGDNKQLKGTVNSRAAELAGFDFSLMDWLQMRRGKSNVPWIMLDVQYRMAPQIAKTVSNLSYGGKLLNDKQVTDRNAAIEKFMEVAWDPKLSSTSVVFDHNYEDLVTANRSRINNGEVILVQKICARLLDFLPSHYITVLTLYEAQRKAILENIKNTGIHVANVDGFQGRENFVIVLSMVRGGTQGIGFASKQHRLNVAISRAKQLQITVCNMSTFRAYRSGAVQRLLSELSANADIRHADHVFGNF